MPKRNLQQRLVAALLARGCSDDVAVQSRKYIKLKHAAEPEFYFVGVSGALRKGATLKGSVSLTNGKLYMALLSEEA